VIPAHTFFDIIEEAFGANIKKMEKGIVGLVLRRVNLAVQ
jgi:hypothetical protein